MDLNDRFNQMTTAIEVQACGQTIQGTGFFYGKLSPKTENGLQWQRIEEMWVATNRHVLLPEISGTEVSPETVILHLRRFNEGGMMEWLKVAFGKEDLECRVRLHASKSVDVALIDIKDRFEAEFLEGQPLAAPYFLGAHHQEGRNNITVEVGDDILVAGYPKGFYDDENLFPIVKAGIIASKWGAHFQGKPCFLIDAKLFSGSSGSVVVSKPTDFVIKDGKPMFSKVKQFALLGIYSGEPQLREEPVQLGELTLIMQSGCDLGRVWYAQTIEEAKTDGVGIKDALMTDTDD